MNKISVLLAGIGGYGQLYLNALLDNGDGSFVFAGAVDPYAASSPGFDVLKERGIPVYKTPQEFFAGGGRADLSVISSPIHTHYSYTVTCFENGSNVLCEKPFSGDLAKLDDIVEREKKTGLFCGVGFQLCFSAEMLALKKDIMNGVFGKPLTFKTCDLRRRGDKYYTRNSWAGKIAIDGENIFDSPLNNACAHDLQLMLFLLGDKLNNSAEAVSVEAELWKARPDIENFDAAALRIKTANNVPVNFYTAHCVEVPETGPVGEFRFEKAVIRWGEKPHSGFNAYLKDGGVKSYETDSANNVTKKLYGCMEAVRSGVPPVCTVKTTRNHLVCVVKAQEFPVNKVSSGKLIYERNTDDGDPFYYAAGLAQAFVRSYNENLLPSETGFTL
jgi:predicted dehydrogenase